MSESLLLYKDKKNERVLSTLFKEPRKAYLWKERKEGITNGELMIRYIRNVSFLDLVVVVVSIQPI